MLSLFRNLTLLILVSAAISACGFQPVYQQKSADNVQSKYDFSSVAVSQINFGRPGQQLQSKLEDLLNPTGKSSEKRYNLRVDVEKKREGIAITQEREITRYNLVVTAKYKLEDRETGKTVDEGTSRMFGSFDAVESDFGTYAAEEDTLARIMGELANNIQVKLTSYFARQPAAKN